MSGGVRTLVGSLTISWSRTIDGIDTVTVAERQERMSGTDECQPEQVAAGEGHT